MEKKRTLILTYHKDAYFFPYIKDTDILICEPIKTKSKLMRALFRIPFLCLFTYQFKKELKKVDRVIIFDSAYNKWLGIYLKHKNKEIYLYFWNTISKMYPRTGKKMVESAKKIMPVYSFDHNDCLKFGLEYRQMVYSKDVVFGVNNPEGFKYDLFFLGWKKDRSKIIEELYRSTFKGNIKCFFILVGDEERTIDDSIVYTKKRVLYEEYLNYVQSSKAILDIPQKGQEGLTIRNVECLFLKKKMVTTNSNIKYYDLYNPNNIYILAEDEKRNIHDFISSTFVDVDDEIVDKYNFVHWVNTFSRNL